VATSAVSRTARVIAQARPIVSIPLHANHANAPKRRHITDAPVAAIGPTIFSASRLVSSAVAAWRSVPSSHAA
jgi:hypothetical protein